MFGQDWGGIGIGFLIALTLALWAVFSIAQSPARPFVKAVWIVIVLFVPYLGFLLWFFVGPRMPKS